jgi:hypothetical protein
LIVDQLLDVLNPKRFILNNRLCPRQSYGSESFGRLPFLQRKQVFLAGAVVYGEKPA